MEIIFKYLKMVCIVIIVNLIIVFSNLGFVEVRGGDIVFLGVVWIFVKIVYVKCYLFIKKVFFFCFL